MTRDSRVLSLCSSPAWCCAAAGTADGGPGSCSRRASTVRDLGGFGGSLPRPRRRCVPALGALCEVGGCVCFCGGQQGTDACRPLLQFLQLIVDNLGRISETVVFLDYSRKQASGHPFSSSTNNRLLPLHLCRMPVAEAAQRLRGALLLTAERGGERGAQDSQPTSDSPAPTLSKSSSRTSLTTASAAATSPFSGIAADGAQDHGATATRTSLELPIGRGDAEGLWQRCVAGQDVSVCGPGGEAGACTGKKPQ